MFEMGVSLCLRWEPLNVEDGSLFMFETGVYLCSRWESLHGENFLFKLGQPLQAQI